MFKTIFSFEIKRWFKNPVFYVYCAIFFGISLFTMMSALGTFDGVTATTSSPTYMNSPINIAGFLNSLNTFVYFLLPTIIGASVYRDYQYNVYHVLFSYPLTKRTYLAGKFLSSLFITLLVSLCCILGFLFAQYLPNVNQELLGPTHLWAYFQAFLILIVPNTILFGLIIFAIVNYARNIYVGFIFVLALFVIQTVLGIMTQDLENRFLVALFDPFGFEPLLYYSRYWSIEEQNTNQLPFLGVVLYNRLIWLGVAVIIAFFTYRAFSFSHLGHSFSRKKEGKRETKENFGSIIRINLPKVSLNYGFIYRLKTAWNISNYDLKAIVQNWTFITVMVVAVLMVLIVVSSIGMVMGTETYPVTWKLLTSIGSVYSFFITILILLFAGILIQRARTAKMDLMVDSTAVPNWVLFLSKFVALLKMTIIIQVVSILTGVLFQLYHGYFHFEIGLYVKELLGLDMLKHILMIMFALFVHSFFKNYFVGFIVCVIIIIGMPFVTHIGIEQKIFIFNAGIPYSYSDMNGYGFLGGYYYYRLYWILFGLVLSGIALMLWRRGTMGSMKDRIKALRIQAKPIVIVVTLLALIGFVSLGYAIYHHDNIAQPHYSAKEKEQQQVDYEKKYKKYADIPSPRLVDVHLEMDLFTKQRNYEAKIKLTYVNKTSEVIDTLFLDHRDNIKSEKLSLGHRLVLDDTMMNAKVYVLDQPLNPMDSLVAEFVLVNEPNTFLEDKSGILENGTFLNNSMFPKFGYNEYMELDDNNVRKKYDLPMRDRMADPTDSLALRNNYISNDADWIDFEAIISTSDDQIAIAPGYLQKEWKEGDRRYFHYKMDNKILNFYSIISARFEVLKDTWNDINLEIYYHKGHEYNLDRMMASMKKSLEYYEKNYSPYQFRQMRIIEFPKTYGTFAQAFANTVPFSEAIGFIAKVDEDDPNGIDYAYGVVAHEFAHQWWAHQVIGSGTKGATMMSESLSEYSSLKVLEHTYGAQQMRRFLKDALDSYLMGRANERIAEDPLMFNQNQPYIHYNKGSLVMYAMSSLWGEQPFNAFLSDFVDRYAFQYPPYVTSLAFVNELGQVLPDSLQYAVTDMFKTITLYDNKINNVTSTPVKGGGYQVDIDFQVSKYRTDSKGKKSYEDQPGTGLKVKDGKSEIKSLPLNDYIDITVYGESKKSGKHEVDHPLETKRIKISKIQNKIRFVVPHKPVEVGVDGNNMLVDTDSEDNRMKI